MLDAGCWLGAEPARCFYADDFGAGRVLGWAFGRSTGAVLTQSHGAAVEFLAGVFGGAFEANFVAVEVGQEAFRAGVHPVDEGQAASLSHWISSNRRLSSSSCGGWCGRRLRYGAAATGANRPWRLADQEFRTGGGGLVLGAIGVEA